MADRIDEFFRQQEEEAKRASVGAAQIVLEGTDSAPDEVAGDLNLSRDYSRITGNPMPPVPLVKENRTVFQQAIDRVRNQTALGRAPRSAEWLRNPENAALAKDIVPEVSWWEATGNAIYRGATRIPQAERQLFANQAAQRSADDARSFAEILSDEMSDKVVRDNDGNVLMQTSLPDPADLFMAATRYVQSRAATAFGGDNKAAAQAYQQQAGAIAKHIASVPMSAAGSEGRALVQSIDTSADVWGQTSEFFQKFAENPAAMSSFLVETAIESLPMLGATAGVAVATRNPTAAASTMGLMSGFTEYGTAPVEFLQEKGLDVSTPEGALLAISNPDLMREASERGVIRGVIIGAMDGLSGGVASQTLAKNPWANMALQAVVQAAFGGGGEAAAQIASGQEVSMAEVLVEAMAEFATAPIEVASVGSGQYIESRRKARAAADTRQRLEEISQNAQTSKLRERSPEKFRDLVATALGGSQIENVFIPASDFVEYFQSAGVDPRELVDELDGVSRDDLDVALAGGGHLRIPTATYAAHMAGSEHDAFFLDNMLFDASEFTSREAMEFNERAEELRTQAFEEAEASRVEADEMRTFEQEIFDTMASRLRAAGRSTDVAANEAMLYPAFYRTMAERSGRTIEELVQEYPLPQVVGDLPEGMQFRNVDELNRALAEARKRRTVRDNRQTLTEFIDDYGGINDEGGELRARDAETIRRPGKKSLRLLRKGFVRGMRDMLGSGGKRYGADDVAAAAIEAGFLADDPIANEYREALREGRQVPDITAAFWDALDRELGGEAQYAVEPDEEVQRAEALDAFERDLQSLGVSLNDDDDTIRQAVEGAREYAQLKAYHGSRTLFSRFSWSAIGSGEGSQLFGYGFYFSASKGVASAYVSDGGHIYEVSIDADPDQLIDTTKPIAEQSDTVKAALKKLGLDDAVRMSQIIPRTEADAKRWAEAGIVGSQFLDVFNDGVGSPATNYVVFDETRLKITEKDGTPLGQEATRVLFQFPAFHGSPYDFDKFSLDHIGKGEGAQAFGHGLYFAESEAVARSYQKNVSKQVWGVDHSGHLYEVSINAEQDDFIDWDKPLSQQSEKVRKALGLDAAKPVDDGSVLDEFAATTSQDEGAGPTLNAAFDNYAAAADLAGRSPVSLADFRSALRERGFKIAMLGGQQRVLGLAIGQASEFRGVVSEAMLASEYIERALKDESGAKRLRESGVAGIRYLDANSRRGAEGTRNFVIFDASLVEITAKDGKPVSSQEREEVVDLLYQRQSFDGARGSIQFPSAGVGRGDTVIRAFQSADLSTVVHESGHYFLAVLQDLAANGEAQATADLTAVREWWRSNADGVAKDAMRAADGVKISTDDVIAALNNGTTGDAAKDRAIDVGMHEQWARGFEAYLMEGKAPSAELKSAFERFRAWLIAVYRRIAALDVSLSDDVRAVFDRMLASDDEIAKAKQDVGGYSPLFANADEMGLTAEEYEAFTKLRQQAEDDAKARTLREVMAPVKREQEKAYKKERAKLREEVEQQVNAYPYFRALEWMGNRRWLGDDQPAELPDMRLSRDILVQRYGEGVLSTLPRGKFRVYANDGGLDPDDVAGWFGFSSGDEMVKALERAPKRADAIEAETDRIMRDRHGDALTDGSLQEEAIEALHGDKRGEWLAAELKAVVEVSGSGVGLTAKDARAAARQTMARMQVRDAIATQRYLAAERKAGQEAARLGAQLAREKVWHDNARRKIASKARAAIRGEASPDAAAKAIEQYNARFETTTSTYTVKGEQRAVTNLGYNDLVAALIDAKRKQLLNHALYMEARNVAQEVEKAERFVANLGKKSKREKIAGAGRLEFVSRPDGTSRRSLDYLAAMDDILDRYDFRRMSGRAEQRRATLAEFIEDMKAAGRENELSIPDDVLADVGRKPYKTVPVEELRGVVESLKNIEHMATRWNKLIDAMQERDKDTAVNDMLAAFEANVKKRPVSRVKSGRSASDRRKGVRQYLDLVLNATTLLREIDGFKDQGATYQNIKAPIDDAMNRLILRREKAANDIEALYEVYSKDERRAMNVPEFSPELGYSLSKWERIAVALNTGNDGNYQRLTDPRAPGSMTEAQVKAVLASLDERDANFVQSVWDYIGSFRKDIEARERRATGTAPAWVDPVPVTIAGKLLKGGYFPLQYDSEISALTRDDEHALQAMSLQGGRFGKAQTRNGHLKARAQSSGRGVDLDIGVLHRHVNQVIYDLELSEPVSNSWVLLQDPRIRDAFIQSGKQADFEALEIWLQDVGNGELRSADWMNRAARTMKSNFTMAKLALNLGTVMVQVTGLAQSSVVVGKRNMARGIQASLRPGVSDEVVSKSAFMSQRQTTFNKDINDFYNDPRGGPVSSRWSEFKRDKLGKIAFYPMTKVQWFLVDVPTWLAGYHQGLSKFKGDEAKAIAHADGIVKRSQASGLFSDRSAIERGSVSRTQRQSDVVRLFTTLGSYMFAKANVAYERSAMAKRNIEREGVSLKAAQEALSWTADMAFLFTLEAVLFTMMKGFAVGWEDDDEEKTPADWAGFLAKETALSVMGTMPFVRDAASSFAGFGGGGAYGSIVDMTTAPIKQALQGEVDAAFVKSVINATGLAAGLPSTQINRAVDASWRQFIDGDDDVAPMEYLLGRKVK